MFKLCLFFTLFLAGTTIIQAAWTVETYATEFVSFTTTYKKVRNEATLRDFVKVALELLGDNSDPDEVTYAMLHYTESYQGQYRTVIRTILSILNALEENKLDRAFEIIFQYRRETSVTVKEVVHKVEKNPSLLGGILDLGCSILGNVTPNLANICQAIRNI